MESKDLEHRTKRERNQAIKEIWLENIELLCECLKYEHRHVIDDTPTCLMPEGYRCEYYVKPNYCGVEKND